MKNLYSTLSAKEFSCQSEAELALCRIAKECDTLSKEIFSILQTFKPNKPNSIVSIVTAAVRSEMYSGQIAGLKEKLAWCQNQLQAPLNVVTSYSSSPTSLATVENNHSQCGNKTEFGCSSTIRYGQRYRT
jgi:hypothetical protein